MIHQDNRNTVIILFYFILYIGMVWGAGNETQTWAVYHLIAVIMRAGAEQLQM